MTFAGAPTLIPKLISLGLLDQKRLTYSAQQGEIRVQYGDRTVMTGVKTKTTYIPSTMSYFPSYKKVKSGPAFLSRARKQIY